jgi:DNA-directed RNA polymerase subunit F
MTVIALSIEDIDRIEDIKPEEVAELRQILENERYLSITEGNVGILFTITSMIIEIDNYIREKGISFSIKIRPSNVT